MKSIKAGIDVFKNKLLGTVLQRPAIEAAGPPSGGAPLAIEAEPGGDSPRAGFGTGTPSSCALFPAMT